MAKIKRKINEIIVHCTDTEYGTPVTLDDLRRWHVVERGYNDIGYHYFIDISGVVHTCRPVHIVGAHCKNHNKNSIGVCYAGGRWRGNYEDTRTVRQKKTLQQLIKELCNSFPITKITGHNEYSNKACPCFDAKKEYSHLIQTLL